MGYNPWGSEDLSTGVAKDCLHGLFYDWVTTTIWSSFTHWSISPASKLPTRLTSNDVLLRLALNSWFSYPSTLQVQDYRYVPPLPVNIGRFRELFLRVKLIHQYFLSTQLFTTTMSFPLALSDLFLALHRKPGMLYFLPQAPRPHSYKEMPAVHMCHPFLPQVK